MKAKELLNKIFAIADCDEEPDEIHGAHGFELIKELAAEAFALLAVEPTEFVKEAHRLYSKTSEAPWVKNYDTCNALWIDYGSKGLRLAYPLDDSRVQFSKGADVDFIVWVHENILAICDIIDQQHAENKELKEAIKKALDYAESGDSVQAAYILQEITEKENK